MTDTPAHTTSSYAEAHEILADERFGVAEAPPSNEVGTSAWLRASVSRFTNGDEHGRRRALVAAQIGALNPERLREAARRRAIDALPADASTNEQRLYRDVPMAALAECLGAPDADAAAADGIAVAAVYLAPGDEATTQRADVATARLLEVFGPDQDVAVARIQVLAQACDATAGLISAALATMPTGDAVTTDAMLEVARFAPPLHAVRRVAREHAQLDGHTVATGGLVLCDVDAANRDPDVFTRPAEYDPQRNDPPSLTFGAGIRPCPAVPQAVALAAGVVEAVRAAGPGRL